MYAIDATTSGDASRRGLTVALALTATYMVVEVVGGLFSGSLALLADAGRMLANSAAIFMALVAMWIAGRPASAERTFGYQRTEILAALANTFSLWVIAAWVVFEAYHRVFVEVPHVAGLPVLIIGMGGVLVNLAVSRILRSEEVRSISVKGAFQVALSDLLGSVAVIVSAALILIFEGTVSNIFIIDPVLSVLIAVLIVWNTRHLIRRVTSVLLEGTPERIDMYELCYRIEEVEGVTLVHDVHVWTIAQDNEAFSAHVLMDPSYHEDDQASLEEIKRIVRSYGITHATVQLERSVALCQEFHHVGHLEFRSEAERLAVFSNSFDSGMPWREATDLYFTNVAIKMKNRSPCCGNLGQPGC